MAVSSWVHRSGDGAAVLLALGRGHRSAPIAARTLTACAVSLAVAARWRAIAAWYCATAAHALGVRRVGLPLGVWQSAPLTASQRLQATLRASAVRRGSVVVRRVVPLRLRCRRRRQQP